MGGKKTDGRDLAIRVKEKAARALSDSSVSDVFSELGAPGCDEAAGSALKAILAEKTAEYVVRAMKETKRRGMRFGAAALIIAAEKDRW